MTKNIWIIKAILMQLFLILALVVAYSQISQVYAHGGNKHGANSFTTLQALQKATELYDRLIASKKLDETWETSLKSITVDTRKTSKGIDTRVGFYRSDGAPESVYIFFSPDGNYSGSNFDGKW